MLKLFDNCKEMLLARSGKFVIGMKSEEGESFELKD